MINLDTRQLVEDWKKAVTEGREWDFWRQYGPNLIAYLEHQNRITDEVVEKLRGEWAHDGVG